MAGRRRDLLILLPKTSLVSRFPCLLNLPTHLESCLFLWSLLALRAWGPVSDFTWDAPEVSNQHMQVRNSWNYMDINITT